MKKIVLRMLALSGILAMSTSCDSTRIISSYESPEMNEPYSNIYVVGISGESMTETEMENYMVKELEKMGYVAAADEDTFDPKMEIDESNRDKVGDKLSTRGYDGILTFSLVDVDEELDYVSGAYSPGYYPTTYGYYNNYWGYYGHYAPLAYDPGYYTSNTVYHMEANLYDVATGELMWAARSETIEPIDATTFAENFAETVARELKEDDIIADETNTAMK